MNQIILLGRLVRDPEVRYTPSGKVVAQFTLAVDRPFANPATGQREADFISCVLWGKPGELLGNTVSKGQRLLVDGRLQIRSYDGKDGQKHWVTEVIVSNFEYIEKKAQSGEYNGQTPAYGQPAAVPQQPGGYARPAAPQQPGGNFGAPVPFDEEVPF